MWPDELDDLQREWLEEQRIEAEIYELERRKHYDPRTDWTGPPDIGGVQWPYTVGDYMNAIGRGESW